MRSKLLLAVVLAGFTASGQIISPRIGVVTDTNGVLLAPRNFFQVNSAALSNAVATIQASKNTNTVWPVAGANTSTSTNGNSVTINSDVSHAEVANTSNAASNSILARIAALGTADTNFALAIGAGATNEAARSATAATNGMGLASGLMAFRGTNGLATTNVATGSTFGLVKPDGTTIVVSNGVLYSTSVGAGDVSGPASSTDGAFPLFNGGTGKILKASAFSPSSFDAAGAAQSATNGINTAAYWPSNHFAGTNAATPSALGLVKVDNSTIIIASDGTLSSAVGGGNVNGSGSSTAGHFALMGNTSSTLITNSPYTPNDFEVAGSSTAATNAIGKLSGLAAFAPTNQFEIAGSAATATNNSVASTNGTGRGTTFLTPKFPAVTNDFWVSTSGSDSNPGNFASPFATATNAIAAVPSGNASVIHFGPGTFDCGTNQLTMASNMKLVGSGKFATVLLSSALGATNPHQFILFAPMNGEISDLTVTNNQVGYCLLGGGDDGHVNSFTNTVIRNTAWYGYSDIFAAEGNNGPSSMDVYDSYLYTYEDVTISGGTSGAGGDPAGSTNNVMRFHNCDITSNPSSPTSLPNGLSSAVGLIWAEGCNIHPVKTNGTVYAVGVVTTGLGYIRLDNCILAASGTNADSDFRSIKTPKSPYLIINNCRRPDGGPLNGSGYFYDGNGVQVSGSNSISYGYGYTNAAANSVAIGNSTATLTISNGVIAMSPGSKVTGTFAGDGSALTNLTGVGGTVPNGLVTNNADADIVVSHLGNTTTIYASSPPSIETGAGMFHTSLTVSNAGVAGTFTASIVGTNAAITLAGTTNTSAAKALLIVDYIQASALNVGEIDATTFVPTNIVFQNVYTNVGNIITNASGYFFQGSNGLTMSSNAVTTTYKYDSTNRTTRWGSNQVDMVTISPISGNVSATSFTGSGATLTSLSASQLTSGTVPMSALSTNVIVSTNQPIAAGQLLIVIGTNASGQLVVNGTNYPAAGAGGAATNAIVSASTNGVVIGTGLTNINFTNFTIAPKIVSGSLVVDGALTNLNTFDSLVPTFTGTGFWLGTNSTITTASNIYIMSLVNLPATGIKRYGELTIVASGADVTVTNLYVGRSGTPGTSDMVSTRVCTNGNTMVLAIDVIPGVSTNVAVVQFH